MIKTSLYKSTFFIEVSKGYRPKFSLCLGDIFKMRIYNKRGEVKYTLILWGKNEPKKGLFDGWKKVF